VALPGGARSKLVMRLDVLPCDEQFLDVLLDGNRVVAYAPTEGRFDFELILPASRATRHLELRWTGTTDLAAPDPRQATALLRLLQVEPAGDHRRRSLHRAVELAGRT